MLVPHATQESVLSMLPVVHKYDCEDLLERCGDWLRLPEQAFSPTEAAPTYVLKYVLLEAPSLTVLCQDLSICAHYLCIQVHTDTHAAIRG